MLTSISNLIDNPNLTLDQRKVIQDTLSKLETLVIELKNRNKSLLLDLSYAQGITGVIDRGYDDRVYARYKYDATWDHWEVLHGQ